MSLLNVTTSGVILLIGLFSFTYANSQTRGLMVSSLKDETAVLYASELLEFFRAFDQSVSLQDYLKINPINSALSPYFFCAHINLLDTKSAKVVNVDPIAALAPSTLGTDLHSVNRYYQVQVIDIKTMNIDTSYCDKPMSTVIVNLGSEDPALPSLRLMVTVGINYAVSPASPMRHLAISTVLPN